MITFPNAKINIGLQVFEKRADGFHNIHSLIYPIPFCDVLEIIPSQKDAFHQYGKIKLDEKANLISKAVHLVRESYKIPEVEIHLIKKIPLGSGLGGGSSNAAFTLKMLNELFQLKMDQKTMLEFALELGSDCPFFIQNKPQIVGGRGENCQNVSPILKGKWLLLAFPNLNLSTKEAFESLELKEKPDKLDFTLPIQKWNSELKNDFEPIQFQKYPELKKLHERIASKAVFSSMSGTGSSIYGVFEKKENIELPCFSLWIQL
ncbi:MAG: 4-(cytidine 5'-diphospho)-2-C-methyl-D-erythritol kinase [Crocinitomicaceae bacterium]|nr:4-(cytidine 5'-diphospho)-2-C-methyl-D-erythritol kinase [Crocinitomicaceae bacterium]